MSASAAREVDPSQFLSTRQLKAYGQEANALGLRATGSPKTEKYVAKLAQRLRRAGLTDVRSEPVPMMQWLADSWSLSVAGESFAHTYYMPYTRATGAAGLSGTTVYVPIAEEIAKGKDLQSALASALAQAPVAGKVAVFDVSYITLPLTGFALLSYPTAFDIGDRDPSGDYIRPWFNSIGPVIDALIAAGATGLVGIWPDLPGDWAQQYTPYDGIFRSVPGLWVDSTGGARAQGAGRQRRAGHDAAQRDRRKVMTHNVIGFIPGRSKELTVLHTHTDGTNGMEENGQIGILATAQYLARLPRASLDRTVMVFFDRPLRRRRRHQALPQAAQDRPRTPDLVHPHPRAPRHARVPPRRRRHPARHRRARARRVLRPRGTRAGRGRHHPERRVGEPAPSPARSSPPPPMPRSRRAGRARGRTSGGTAASRPPTTSPAPTG